MATAKNKSAKQSSNIFHNIMAASVKGNPKPAPKKKVKEKMKLVVVILLVLFIAQGCTLYKKTTCHDAMPAYNQKKSKIHEIIKF